MQTKSAPTKYDVPVPGAVTVRPVEAFAVPGVHPLGPTEEGWDDKSRAGAPPCDIEPLYPWHTYHVSPTGNGNSSGDGIAWAEGGIAATNPNAANAKIAAREVSKTLRAILRTRFLVIIMLLPRNQLTHDHTEWYRLGVTSGWTSNVRPAPLFDWLQRQHDWSGGPAMAQARITASLASTHHTRTGKRSSPPRRRTCVTITTFPRLTTGTLGPV